MKNLIIAAAYSAALLLSAPCFAAGEGSGGSSTGGGNSINAQMIEAFAVRHPEEDYRFKSILAILDGLKTTSPYLASTLRDSLNGLKWYILPVELNKIPQYQNGLFFETDQTAFQSRGEVFISQSKLNEMINQKTEAPLFIHELFMAEILKYQNQVDAVAHTRVRMMTEAIMNGLTGEAFNRAIVDNGFQQSANADVWTYNLILQDQRQSQLSGRAVVFAKKGPRVVIYTCAESSLEILKQKRIDSNQDEPQGFAFLVGQALRSNDCNLFQPFMYTLTKTFQNESQADLDQKLSAARTKGLITGGVATEAAVIVLSRLAFRKLNPYGDGGLYVAEVLVTDLIGGAFATIGGAGLGAHVADKQVSKEQFAMRYALAMSKSDNHIVTSSANPEDIAKTLMTGLDQLNDLKLIMRTSVSVK